MSTRTRTENQRPVSAPWPRLGAGKRRPAATWRDNRGYAMAALLVAMSVMSIMLSIALPVWRTATQREREAELIFRGEQYAHAIELFSRRTGGFPTSLDALREGRYIRKLYKDPITNGDFQPVYVGQVATPTPGLPAQGGRAVPGGGVRGQPAGFRGTPAVARGRAGLTPVPGRFGQPPAGVAGQPGGRGQLGAFSTGPIIGVVSTSTNEALRLYNGRGRYNEWLFVSVAATRAPQAGAPPDFQPSLGDGRVLRVPPSRRQQLLPQSPRGGGPQLPPGGNPPAFPGRNLQPPSGRNPRGRL